MHPPNTADSVPSPPQAFGGEQLSACMASMDTLVRKKGYKRRAAGRLRWSLVDRQEIAVQMFNLVQPCPAPTFTNVDAITHTMLRCVHIGQ